MQVISVTAAPWQSSGNKQLQCSPGKAESWAGLAELAHCLQLSSTTVQMTQTGVLQWRASLR